MKCGCNGMRACGGWTGEVKRGRGAQMKTTTTTTTIWSAPRHGTERLMRMNPPGGRPHVAALNHGEILPALLGKKGATCVSPSEVGHVLPVGMSSSLAALHFPYGCD